MSPRLKLVTWVLIIWGVIVLVLSCVKGLEGRDALNRERAATIEQHAAQGLPDYIP